MLRSIMERENHETVSMYPDFAKKAEEEGFKDAARLFRQIGKVEERHRERYKKLFDMLENGTVFKREKPINWKCSICGYVVEGTEPPQKCPCCQKPREYYEPECI